jgi:hypothetical protein
MGDKLFKNDDVLAGVYLPRLLIHQLDLAAVKAGLTRSALQKILIRNFLKDQNTESNIQDIATNIFNGWSDKSGSLHLYLLKSIRPKLERRKLSKEHIELILKRIGELYGVHTTKQDSRRC